MIPRCAQVILVEVRCGCVIIRLLREWLRLEPLRRMIARTISKASSDQTNERTTENHWPTERPRSSNSSESGRIATKRATHLRAVGSRPTDQMIIQIQTRVQAPPLRSGLVRGLDQGLEVWNWPGARSRPRRFWRFKGFRRLI